MANYLFRDSCPMQRQAWGGRSGEGGRRGEGGRCAEGGR